jgi:ell wall binding domain 2 (CWB2)
VQDLPDVAGLATLDRTAIARFAANRAVGTRTDGVGIAAVPPEECQTVTDTGVPPTMLRYAGSNRYETAVCVSFWTWPAWDDPEVAPELKAKAVVLARGDAFPDALAGGPLAAYAQGPLLLTPPDDLPSAVLNEIQLTLAPGGLVYLLGGTSSVSNGIQSELQAAGFATKRLAGSNRYETALTIAEELPDTSNFFFVTGNNFPDALGAGTAAAALSLSAKLDTDPETLPFPLLLTNDATMPTATRNFVINRGTEFGVWSLLTAGGAADRAAATAFGADSLAARFVGSNRYETATMIAASNIFIDPETGVLAGLGAGLATGLNFPDALPATSSLVLFGEPLLLTPSTQLHAATRDFLVAHEGEGAFLDVFGGPSTISNTVANQARTAFAP